MSSYNERRRVTFFDAKCSECGADCTVPFKPDPDRPVYCKECFRKRRDMSRVDRSRNLWQD
jgi:CxxC-x17-CxxC domain-containing protein